MSFLIYGFLGALAFLSVWTALWIVSLRRIVSTNEVHILQRTKTTVSYGKDTTEKKGNVYYQWPTWIPVIGVSVIRLPVSVFQLKLDAYDAYDKGRLPFEIDIVAFFRVADSNIAASRVASFNELQTQLEFIVKGAARTILASYDIDEIMVDRSKFGDHFTKEVESQLANWGVQTVKNIELMDIRDAEENKVIHNIMAKKKSFIEMESRREVAANMQKAETAEIEAKQAVDVRSQEAAQMVGQREAEKAQQVGIAQEQAKQAIKEQERMTKEKDMAVLQVQEVKNQEIIKQKAVVKAEEEKQTAVIRAEGQKAQTVLDAEATKAQAELVAEGNLSAKLKEAQGIEAEGKARGEAETALQMAPVNAQIALAEEIGQNEKYQTYLQTIEAISAQKVIGVEQAKALVAADVKVIANTGNAPDGVRNVMELFTSRGGTQFAGMAEAMNNSDMGRSILNALGIKQPPGNDLTKDPEDYEDDEDEELSTGTSGPVTGGRRKKAAKA